MAALRVWRPLACRPCSAWPGQRRALSGATAALAHLFAAVEAGAGAGAGAGADADAGAGEAAPTSTGPVHIVQSTGTSPYANLAVEQRLLERSHPDSRVLFLYHNAPCVVIGRNQNPWAEVALAGVAPGTREGAGAAGGKPWLVRRRSGGGAVYHDAGNANWSVLTPAADFDRDRHALMVAAALGALGVQARVNERHDIVVDDAGAADGVPRKISGSAYKLTRRRALHHGTCLLTADLAAVHGLLRAPAAAYVRARGVASVRSPVQNVFPAPHAARDAAPPHRRFAAAVVAAFERLHGRAASRHLLDLDAAAADGFAFDPALARGYGELATPDWLYGQTPQFAFSTRPTADDDRARPPRPAAVPPAFHLAFTVRHGVLQDVAVEGVGPSAAAVAATLEGQTLCAIRDWTAAIGAASPTLHGPGLDAVGAWLDSLFGVGVSA